MDNSERAYVEDYKLRLTAIVYYGVMLAGFVAGLYGLFSLFFLASAEVQTSARILP